MKYLTFILFVVYLTQVQAQKTITLEESLSVATESSLSTKRAKNLYRSSYWAFRAFRAKQLPQMELNLTPIEFRRTTTSRYDYEQNIDIYREQKNLSNQGNLSLYQQIPLTGGRIYIDSDLGRLANFGDTDFTTYSATWLRLGISQPIWGFNAMKWEKKTAQLNYSKSEREYILAQQETKLKTVELYFELHISEIQKHIAKSNFEISDKLLRMGKKKKKILAISKEELLNLELNRFTAEVEITKTEQKYAKARFAFHSFLSLPLEENYKLRLPDLPLPVIIDNEKALQLARKNNPLGLQNQLLCIEADRDVEQVNRESRFKASLQASVGLNQYDETLSGAYRDPLNQELISLSVRIPILDWGQGKGDRLMAASKREVVYAEVQQRESDFEQRVRLNLLELQLQPKQVESARKAKRIAEVAFELAQARFISGKADVLQLTNAMQNNQLAHEKYVRSILDYWRYYYQMQMLTLFDLKTQTELTADFAALNQP